MEGLSRCVERAGTRKEKVTENGLRCFVNVIFMIKLLRFERCWHETEPYGWWWFHIWFHCGRPHKHDGKQISLQYASE